MITCPKCKKELEDGTKFCYACGSPVEAPTPAEETPAVEPTPVVESTPVVNPTPVVEPTPAVDAEPKANPAQDVLAKVKQLPLKVIGIAAAAVVAVIVLIVLVGSLLGGGEKRPEYAVYLKDDQLYLSLLGGKEAIEITEDLAGDWSTESIMDEIDEISSLIYLTDDKKTIIYPDDITYDGFTLYYRSATKEDAEGEKIDKDIRNYVVSENEKLITYVTSDGKLYQYNFKDKEKVASDVYYFYASEDGKRIVYVDYDDTIYLWENGEDEKIAKDANVVGVANDLDTIFYTKEGKLYVKEGNKDEVKIDSDVYSVLATYEDGSVYFVKSDSRTVSLADYVNDDMLEADANMVEPEYPDYDDFDWPPYPWYDEWMDMEEYADCANEDEAYDRYEELYDAVDAEYEAAYDAYYEAYDLYWDKDNRDYIREYLADAEMEVSYYTLYFYDGKEVVEVAEDFQYSNYRIAGYDATPVIVFETEKTAEIEKLNMSEIDSYWDVEDHVYYAEKSTTLNVAVKGTATATDLEDVYNLAITRDGKELYVLADVDYDDYTGTLYNMSISGKPGKAEVYDEDVTCGYLVVYANGKVAYTKENGEEFFVNKEMVDEDVYASTIMVCDEGDTIYYLKDLDYSDYTGSLCISKNGKEGTEIADDVFYTFSVTSEGNVLYLADFDVDDIEGTLCFSKDGKEGKEIDDEAQMIISPFPYGFYNLY